VIRIFRVAALREAAGGESQDPMKNWEQTVSSLFWVFVAGAVMVSAYGSSIGTLNSPESGFLPFFAALFLGVFSLVNLGLACFPRPGKTGERAGFPPRESNWRYLPLVLGTLFAFPLLLGPLGFNATVFGFTLLLTRVIGGGPWKKVIPFSLLTTGFCYLLFVRWLKFVVEKGILGI
jgi:hypothetical protein